MTTLRMFMRRKTEDLKIKDIRCSRGNNLQGQAPIFLRCHRMVEILLGPKIHLSDLISYNQEATHAKTSNFKLTMSIKFIVNQTINLAGICNMYNILYQVTILIWTITRHMKS